MSGSHKKLCFRAPGGKQTDIIPNAKVQGIISDEVTDMYVMSFVIRLVGDCHDWLS